MAARDVLRVVAGRRGNASLTRPAIDDITAGHCWPVAEAGRKLTPDGDRRPVARGGQRPRQVLQRPERAATRRKHRQRARGFHRSVGHRHRGGARGRAVDARRRSFGYRTSYENGWWGDVTKYALDPNTGALPVDTDGNPLNPPVWSAAHASRRPGGGHGLGHESPHRDDQRRDADRGAVPARKSVGRAAGFAHRRLVDDARRRPTAQPSLNFLRGDKSNEGVGTSNFRVRVAHPGRHRLFGRGARRRAEPALRRRGQSGLHAFAADKGARTPMVYVGGNDGMMHAFDRFDDAPTPARKPGRTFPRRCSPPATRTTPRTRRLTNSSSARSATVAAAIPLLPAQVLRQRHAAHLGHRFRQHQHHHAADNRQRLAHDAGRRPGRGRARGLCARRHDAGQRSPTPKTTIAASSACCGRFTDDRHARLRLRRADTRQDEALRLGGAGRFRLQQHGRQRRPVRAQSEERDSC